MKFRFVIPFALAALVALVAVPAFACGEHRTQSDNETITAQAETPAVEATEATEATAEPTTDAVPGCACQHGQQAAQEDGDEGTESDTELTDTTDAADATPCPYHSQAVAPSDDES